MAPLVVDPVHLSLGGYAELARLVADAVDSVVTGRPIAPAPAPGAPGPDIAAYVEMMDRQAESSGAHGFCMTLRIEGAHWLSVGAVIFGAGLLQEAWDTCQDDAAGVALAWLYERFDLVPDLPDDVVARASSIDIEAHLAAASRCGRRRCGRSRCRTGDAGDHVPGRRHRAARGRVPPSTSDRPSPE